MSCLGSQTLAAGIDTYTAELMIRHMCSDNSISLLDTCGDHANPRHFHEMLTNCLSGQAISGHSTRLGTSGDNRGIYGFFEADGVYPTLDVCGAHVGITPDSNGQPVVHYHSQVYPPFFVGCYTNADATMSFAQCRALFTSCSSASTIITTAHGTGPYQRDCPCWDKNTRSNVIGASGTMPAYWPNSIKNPPIASSSPGAAPSPALSACGPAPSQPVEPCFPSSALVTMADGTLTRLDALKQGDVIVATTAEGTLTTDTVSPLSISKPEVTATTFVTLTIDAGKSLNLTAEHYLPAGAECCSTLKQAKEIAVGETVWAVKGRAVVACIVSKKSHATHKGLHSPVLSGGALPVVDGFVTAFDGPTGVLLASYALKPLLRTCQATGTCPVFKRVVAALTGRKTDDYIP
jgi:hypothetical protein